eukprot:scaffold176704_cov27-Tisochrysis_lutea.AAC.1
MAEAASCRGATVVPGAWCLVPPRERQATRTSPCRRRCERRGSGGRPPRRARRQVRLEEAAAEEAAAAREGCGEGATWSVGRGRGSFSKSLVCGTTDNGRDRT